MPASVRVPIQREADIVLARQAGRALAVQLGFSPIEQTLIATAISEVARNIVAYAQQGEIVLGQVHAGARIGIQVTAIDEGPGIDNKDLGRERTGPRCNVLLHFTGVTVVYGAKAWARRCAFSSSRTPTTITRSCCSSCAGLTTR